LYPISKCIIDNFAAEHQTPEIIAVGLNAIREMACRSPLALTEDKLTVLMNFVDFKNKSVVMAARSLLNLYRQIYPSLLLKKFRGKEASIAVSSATDKKPEFGRQIVHTTIDGADLLFRYRERNNRKQELETDATTDSRADELSESDSYSGDESVESIDDSDDDDEENVSTNELVPSEDFSKINEENVLPCEVLTSEDSAKVEEENMLTTELLTSEDFSKISKLRSRAQAQAREAGGRNNKRKRDEYESLSDISSESEQEDEQSRHETAGSVDPKTLLPRKNRERTKAARVASINKGREGRAKFGTPEDTTVVSEGKGNKKRHRQKPTKSDPNAVKARKKPLLMAKHAYSVRGKSKLDAKAKVKILRNHVKTLKMKTGGATRRRRH